MNKDQMKKFVFDLPRIPESAHLFHSKIDWEASEKELEEEENNAKKKYGIGGKTCCR